VVGPTGQSGPSRQARGPYPTGGIAAPPRPWRPAPGYSDPGLSGDRLCVLAWFPSGTDPLAADPAADVHPAAHHASTGGRMESCMWVGVDPDGGAVPTDGHHGRTGDARNTGAPSWPISG